MQKGFFIFAFRDQETIMKVWLLFIFGIVPIISQAQNRMISGEVTDKEYNPIEFVTISLLSANDSSLIAGTITNEKGKFTLSCEEKKDYIVRASHIEYTTPSLPPVNLQTIWHSYWNLPLSAWKR